MPAPSFCANCGAALTATAKYCHRCGTARGAAASGAAPGAAQDATPGVMPAATGNSSLLPWSFAGIAVLSLLAFVAGTTWRRGQPQARMAPTAARAPDISQMSPDERADRLFQRVMTYVAQGQDDSVRFFAPMAIQSIAALAPLDAHRRYDLGLLGVVSGDAAMARAEADTILAAQPSHLLGLILAMRASGLELDTLARRRFAERFLSALPRERPRALPEYVDHAPDIDAAAREATAKPPSPPR
jgi:hypothetical protein